MTSTLRVTGKGAVTAVLPPQLAAIMRPELPSLAEEIIGKIRGSIPEYANLADSRYADSLPLAVEQALKTFVDLIADPSAGRDELQRICRELGRREARAGRRLDDLQAAYRVGTQVAWGRVMSVGPRTTVASAATISLLAARLFRYMDEMAEWSVSGYREAMARSDELRLAARRRLIELIVERAPAPLRAIIPLAEQAGWAVPAEVTPVAVRWEGDPPAGECLPDDVLADLANPQPCLLLPGRFNPARRAALAAALPGDRIAVGLTVPLPDAADSLRWAKRALTLAEAGVIDDAPVTLCEDHLVTLLLFADSTLAGRFARRQLAVLAELTPAQRDRLTETFSTLLDARGSATEVAGRLKVHPQTVRYRKKRLEELLGDQLGDPQERFATELALRIMRLRGGRE
jgi:hypothetical protein